MLAVQYIPAIFEELVAKARIKLGMEMFFDKGHYNEIVAKLTDKSTKKDKPARYPLVWLVLDMKESIAPRLGIYADVDVQIIIAQDTKPTYTVQERVNQKFLPILYPIYQELLNQIMSCEFLSNSLPGSMKHDKWDRYYWGGQDANGNGTANLFNDFIDAIQIKGLTLSVKKQFCETLSIK